MALLSAFNPHDMPETTLRGVATGREPDLARILSTVRSNLAGGAMQHLILSAPRGYGKSFLMRLLQLEIERVACEEGLALVPLLMPEEMPHVKAPETLINELTRVLRGGAASETKYAWGLDDDSAFESAAEALKGAIREKVGEKGLCVALVENFDRLLLRAFPKEAQRLRLRVLLSGAEMRLMLIAASASGAFDRNYDSALFHAFDEIALEAWTDDEVLAFFDRQRRAAGRAPLGERMRARVRAVAAFIGGTPRLATLLGDLLLGDDVLGAAELLRRLVDELTPYYKERIEALPGRSQVLLDALLRGGEPATQSELARRVGAPSQAAIAAPFDDLAREKIVVGVKAAQSAERLYRVVDRVFAHYYRFRIIDHGRELCPLEALVDLLAEFFTPDEKRGKADEFARAGRLPEARVMARLADAESGATRAGRQHILIDLEINFVSRVLETFASAALAQTLRTAAKTARGGAIDAARAEIDEALKLAANAEDRVALWLFRQSLDAYEGFRGGLAAADEAIVAARSASRKAQLAAALGRVWSLLAVRRYEEAFAEAEALSARAHEFGEAGEESHAWWYAGDALRGLGRWADGHACSRRAASIADALADNWREGVARSHCALDPWRLGRPSEALVEGRRAIDLNVAARDALTETRSRVWVAGILSVLNRRDKALVKARHAQRLADALGDLSQQGIASLQVAISLTRQGRLREAAAAAERAARHAREAGDAWTEGRAIFESAWAAPVADREDKARRFRLSAPVSERAGDWEYAAASWRLAATFSVSGPGELHLDDLAQAARVLTAHEVPSESPALINLSHTIGQEAGANLPTASAPDDLEPFATALHALLARAAALDFEGVGRQVLRAWTEGLADQALSRETDPARLDLLAEALEIRFPGQFEDLRKRLTAAAGYHRAGRAPVALERLDPDFARALALMHPPREETAKRARRTKGKAR